MKSIRHFVRESWSRPTCRAAVISIASFLLVVGLVREWSTVEDLPSTDKKAAAVPQTQAIADVAQKAAKPTAQPALVPQKNTVAKTGPASPPALSKPKNPEKELWSVFSAARHQIQTLTKEESAMLQNQGVRFFAANPGQQLTARFLDDAVRIESGAGGSWQGNLQLTGISKGDKSLPMPKSAKIQTKGDRIEYQRGSVMEWVENRTQGFEHGYTIQEPIAGGGDAPLQVEVRMSGLVSSLVTPEQANWKTADGVPVLAYNGLKVWDAKGQELPAHLAASAQPDSIAIVVADAGAVYPLTIDPLITTLEQKLGPEVTGTGAAEDRFGASVALSSDTAIIGTPGDDTPAGVDAGSAYVFLRTSSLWGLQAQLRPATPAANSAFGSQTALSGNTALVATTTASAGVIVFVRSGTTWTQQAVLNSGIQETFFPAASISLSGDTALVGTPAAERAYVFTRTGVAWSHSATLQANGGQSGDLFGSAVSVSGTTSVVGAPGDGPSSNDGTGYAFVFVQSGTSWSQQQKLTSLDAATGDAFGSAVAASGDTTVIGAPNDDTMAGNNAGSGYVFTRSGTTWTQQGVLTALDAAADDFFGTSVALENNRTVLGAPTRNSAYIFDRTGSFWTQQARLKVGDATGADALGAAVAVSSDTVLLGAPGDDTRAGSNAGTAFVFVRSDLDCCEPGDPNNPASWCQQARLSPGDAAVNDFFGRPVAIQGDTAAIGAQGDDSPAGSDTGAVYIFTRTGTVWSMEARITSPDGSAFDNLGSSVALLGSGDRLATGAIGDDTTAGENAGSVYIFGRMGGHWSQLAKLTAPDGASYDAFGRSVAIEGTRLLIGAAGNDTSAGEDAGSAYVFYGWDGFWVFQKNLTAGDASAFDNFGQSVALSGNSALIGAMGDDIDMTQNAGSAYVFVFSSNVWSQQARLNANPLGPNDSFGHSVAISGDTALVGTSAADTTAGVDAGAAFVFTRAGSTWTQQAQLTASDGAAGDQFGIYVALAGSTAIIAAPQDDQPGANNAGSTYVFMRKGSTWTQEAKLLANDGAAGDLFGSSVAISGNTVLVGANCDDGVDTLGEAAMNQGGVYVFRLWTSSSADMVVEHPLDSALVHEQSIIDFGSVVVGGRVERTVYIRNMGAQNLTAIKATIDGTNRAEFKVEETPPTSLEPTGLASFIVSFGPLALGSRSATLKIASSDPDVNPFIIQLRGNGYAATIAEIVSDPKSLLVPLNSTATFTASAVGQPSPALLWKRNNTAFVPKTTTATLSFIATLTNVGVYTMTATNGGGSQTTDPAELGVVDTSEKTLIRPTGGSAVMTVVSAGNGLSHQWLRNGQPFTLHSRATVSANGKTLTIVNLTTDDAGTYACEVTGPGGTLVGGTHHLRVIDGHPLIIGPVYMPSGMVGVPYTFSIPIDLDPARAPDSYGATGLPAGLSVNTMTGVISGIPTRSGLFNVVLKATNIKGTYSANAQLYISPLPCGTSGDFNGLVDRRGSLNGGFGGTITVKVETTGAFSGALTLGSLEKLPFTGTLNVTGGYNQGPPPSKTALTSMGGATAQVSVSRKAPLCPVTLQFTIDYYQGTLRGTITDPWCNPRTVSPFVGQPDIPGSEDGNGTAALFDGPRGMVFDSNGNMFVADSYNNVIRKVTPYGVVTTFAGTAGLCGSTDGSGFEALFHAPEGLAIDANDNLYVADTCNSTIRKITPYGVVTTVAGSAGLKGSVNGTGIAARFVCPVGVAVDKNGNVYVTDFTDHTIRKITPARLVTTFAGKSGLSGSSNGSGSAARFNSPYGIAFDKKGVAYVTDSGNHVIRTISTSGVVTTFAGAPGVVGHSEGLLANARFNSPHGIAFDSSENIFITDTGSHLLRRISCLGVVCNVAGRANESGWANGTGSEVLFDRPVGVAISRYGFHCITEQGAHSVRKGFYNSPVPVNVLARRNPWGSDVIPTSGGQEYNYCYNPPATHLAGTYNVAAELPEMLAGVQAYPQGNSFGTMTVTTRGTVTWVGFMADGAPTTCSTMLGGSYYNSYINYVPLHFMLYGNTGSAQGWQELMSDYYDYNQNMPQTPTMMSEILIDGVLDWYKIPEALPASRSYAQGIPLHVQTTLGEENMPPPSNQVVLGFGPPPGNALLSFTEGGIGFGFGQIFNISTSNVVSFPSVNPNQVKMTTFNASTSKFSGNFTLSGSGDNPRPTSTTKKSGTSTSIIRTANFNGVLLRRLGQGVGYFLLNQLPSAGPPPTTLTTSPILSGQVIIEANRD
jgi:sugar lactone lactonase YvrE